MSLLLFSGGSSQPRRRVAFRPVGGGFRMPHSAEACSRLRSRLMERTNALGAEIEELGSFWLPTDKGLPVVYFEAAQPHVILEEDSARVAEFIIEQVEHSDGAWSYTCRAVVRGDAAEPYGRTVTYSTARHVEEHYVAWLQAIWPRAEEDEGLQRRPTISNDEAHQIRADLEGTLAAVEAELHEGRLPDHVEHDLRLLIQQLHHWSNMVEPTTQGFEHILAEITRRIIDNTHEPHRMRHRLIQLGADPTVAAAVDASVRDTLNDVTSLGAADDRIDGTQLSAVAQQVDRLEGQLQEMVASAPRDSGLAEAMKKGAGNEAGARAVTVAVQTLVDNWDKIRLGLAVAWKSITAIFLSNSA